MRDEQIMKVEDLTEHIESRFKSYDKRHQLFFRGQLHKYDMEPTIYRNGGKYFSEESKLCDENFENGKTDIQNLAHMQHPLVGYDDRSVGGTVFCSEFK